MYAVKEIPRELINPAAYNPRIIDESNKKALTRGIKEHGLVEALVWNERTGNLVSGHQRLSVLDKLERGTDYTLDVAVIDVDEREEAILNVQLNNGSMQGVFEQDLLGSLISDFAFKPEDVGFTDFDMSVMFGGDERFAELFPDTDGVKSAKDELREIKKQRDSMNQKLDTEQKSDTYIVVVCENADEKNALMKSMNVPVYERYVTVKELRRLYEKTG
jgi:hypothetical protein